jgi:hypothetical protein
MIDMRVTREVDLAGDPQAKRRRDNAFERQAVVVVDCPDAVEMLQKVLVPGRAAELAVRNSRQPDRVLLFDRTCDLVVLDRPEFQN